jgi:hypothetical protein
LKKPGEISTKQRVFFETCAPLKKTPQEDGPDLVEEEEEFDKVFEDAKTYVSLKLTTSNAIVPKVPENPEPTVAEIVNSKQFITWPYSKDPCDDFCKQVTLATESLAKEFYNMFESDIQRNNEVELATEIMQKQFDE